jgi:hypothetical protein
MSDRTSVAGLLDQQAVECVQQEARLGERPLGLLIDDDLLPRLTIDAPNRLWLIVIIDRRR